jgi:hypothetical protein
MIDVARQLWGEPSQSKGDKWRWGGDYDAKTLNLQNLKWYDHGEKTGGGYASLYKLVHGRYPNGGANGSTNNIVNIYDYRDEQSGLLFQVLRLLGHKFFQRRPDGNGGWINKITGIRRVLYKLPELLAAAADSIVFVCEGEKDVDALRALGLVATTNPGGAGKWREAFNECLRGRHVVVLPDNDPQATDKDGKPKFHADGRPVLPGQDHAAEVASNLHGIAASVKVLMLPDLPEKGDVSDWLANGGTADELQGSLAKRRPINQKRSRKRRRRQMRGQPSRICSSWRSRSPPARSGPMRCAGMSFPSSSRSRSTCRASTNASGARSATGCCSKPWPIGRVPSIRG